MIDPKYFEQFKQESIQFEHLKDKVKKYIESRYVVSTKCPVSVFSVRVGFQMVIGDVPQSVLAYWLQEWGYKVDPSKGFNTDGVHNVFLKQKPLVEKTEEEHYKKEWKAKRKGSIVY